MLKKRLILLVTKKKVKENVSFDNSSMVQIQGNIFMSRNRMFTLRIKTNEAKCLKASIKGEA
ncbi:hypothetical protein CR513_57044, partial [Mucuna pruriens]